MSYCSKEFLESTYLNLVKVQKLDGSNKCSLAQKKVVLLNCIFYQENIPFPGEYIINNIRTLLARSVYKQQVHPVLILSIWNKYGKLFHVKYLVNRLHTTADGIRNSEHVLTAIIYYIFENKPSRRCNMWEIPVKQFTR